jgi:hypothetical protein
VCGELIKKGKIGEAVQYMERVRRLVDTLVTKLRAKVGPEDTPAAAGEGPKDVAPVGLPVRSHHAPSFTMHHACARMRAAEYV